MDEESLKILVELLSRIDVRLDSIEKRIDTLAAEMKIGDPARWTGLERRVADEPIAHPDRRDLLGEL